MKMTHQTTAFISLRILTLGFLAVTSVVRADDIIIDGTTYNSFTVFTTDTTANTSVIFENNVTIGVASGVTLNLAGANNQVGMVLTNTSNPSTLTFGTAGETGTIIIGGGSGVDQSELSHPYHITVANGTLQSAGTNVFASFLEDSTLVTVNANLDMNGVSSSIELLQGSSHGRVFNNSGTQSVVTISRVDNSPSTMTYAGTIEGNIEFVDNSNYALVLTGDNTYTGGTTVGAGADLQIQDLATNLGSGPITLAGGILLTSPTGSGAATTATQDLALQGSAPSTLEAADGTVANYQNLSGGPTTTLKVGDASFHQSTIGFSGNAGFTGEIVVASGMTIVAENTDALGTGTVQIGTGNGVASLMNGSTSAITLDNAFSLNQTLFLYGGSGGAGPITTLSNTISDLGTNHGIAILQGQFVFHGTNDYTGGTAVSSGSLFFSKDENLGSSLPAVYLDNAYLVYDGIGQGSTPYVSNATISMLGPVSIGGLGAATGSTIVYSNTVSVPFLILGYPDGTGNYNGEVALTGNNTSTSVEQLYGRVGVGSKFALGTGDYTMEGGVLQTYGGQQEIRVQGNYDQENGTLYLNAAGHLPDEHEVLDVVGSLKLDPNKTGDAVLSINLQGGYRPSEAAPLLVANSNIGIDGEFDEVLLSNGGKAFAEYTGAGVYVYELAFAQTPGLTPNQQSVANNLDLFNALPNSSAAQLVDVLSPLAGDAALAPILDQLSPQSLQVLGHVAFDNATFNSQQLNNHLANLRDGLAGFDGSQLTYSDPTLSAPLAQIKGRLLAWNPESTPGLMSDSADLFLGGMDMKDTKAVANPTVNDPWSTFIAGNVILADLGNNSDMSRQNYTTGSVTAGADYQVTPHLRVGAEFAYAHTDANLDYLGSNATIDSYSPGIYASYVDGGWYGNGSFNYAYNSDTESRNVQIGAINGTNHGAAQGNQYTGNLTGGYEFQKSGWKFGPVAGLQYANLGLSPFNESGPTALSINSQSAESFRSQLGVEVRYAVHTGSVVLTPHASASWQHEFLDDSRGITSSFNGSGAGSFTVTTSSPERDSAFIDIGLNADVTSSLTLFTDYSTEAGQSHFFAQSVQAGLKIGF